MFAGVKGKIYHEGTKARRHEEKQKRLTTEGTENTEEVTERNAKEV